MMELGGGLLSELANSLGRRIARGDRQVIQTILYLNINIYDHIFDRHALDEVHMLGRMIASRDMRVQHEPKEQNTEVLDEEEDVQPDELEDRQLIRSMSSQEQLACFNLCFTQETDVTVPERSQTDKNDLKLGIKKRLTTMIKILQAF